MLKCFCFYFIRDALVVTTLDTFTSLLAGCTIFGILGNLAFETGVENVGQVVQSQTGLAFISYPDAIAKFERFPQVKKNSRMSVTTKIFLVRVIFAGIFSPILFHAFRVGHWQ
jgi:SNF family Na+-dependent transporter